MHGLLTALVALALATGAKSSSFDNAPKSTAADPMTLDDVIGFGGASYKIEVPTPEREDAEMLSNFYLSMTEEHAAKAWEGLKTHYSTHLQTVVDEKKMDEIVTRHAPAALMTLKKLGVESLSSLDDRELAQLMSSKRFKLRVGLFGLAYTHAKIFNRKHCPHQSCERLNSRAFLTYDEQQQMNGMIISEPVAAVNVEDNKSNLRDSVRSRLGTSTRGGSPPASLDWRVKNFVSPVRNQGQCGSCWAFAATAVLESRLAISRNDVSYLLYASPQNMVSCDVSGGNNGCSGGMYDRAWRWTQSNPGVTSAAIWPYVAKETTCDPSLNSRGIIGWGGGNMYTVSTEAGLLSLVAEYGPVAIAIQANQACFQQYSGGILSPTTCSCGGANLDHAVVVVGYGTENGVDYWIVQNSWGSTWGEAGYIRLQRNVPPSWNNPHGGMCGLLARPLAVDSVDVTCSKSDAWCSFDSPTFYAWISSNNTCVQNNAGIFTTPDCSDDAAGLALWAVILISVIAGLCGCCCIGWLCAWGIGMVWGIGYFARRREAQKSKFLEKQDSVGKSDELNKPLLSERDKGE